MKFVLLGPPGCGKGTQAELIQKDFDVEYIYPGAILREEIKKDTQIGRAVKEAVESGELVPTNFVTELVKLAVGDHEKYLIDRFPRNMGEVEHMGDLQIDFVVYINIPKEEVVTRLLKRGRKDDTKETIAERYQVYQEETEPVLAHYREKGILKEVDGIGSIKEVYERVSKRI